MEIAAPEDEIDSRQMLASSSQFEKHIQHPLRPTLDMQDIQCNIFSPASPAVRRRVARREYSSRGPHPLARSCSRAVHVRWLSMSAAWFINLHNITETFLTNQIKGK